MRDVFLSCNPEDQSRVGPLVRALGEAGLPVRWDQGLNGGDVSEKWQAALDGGECVIVVWTYGSVGPDGALVREEASRALRHNTLVAVLLDPVMPPGEFGEVQTIDLTAWKGQADDLCFQDLCSAVAAKRAGAPVPPAIGRKPRRLRRVVLGGAGVVALSLVGVGFNLFSAQDQLCGLGFAQPRLSDACGAMGFGSRPTKFERLAWEGRAPGDCEALRSHIERFPDGAFRAVAAEILQARRVVPQETWVANTRRMVLVGNPGEQLFQDRAQAQSAALAGSQSKAEKQCKSFAASLAFQFVSARIEPQQWRCQALQGGVACDFEGEVSCELRERQMVEEEFCAG